MSVRILPESDIQVLAAFGQEEGIFDQAGAAAFAADIRDANRRLYEEAYGPNAEPRSAGPIDAGACRSRRAAAAAFAVVVYNAGSISEETRVALGLIGEALVAAYTADQARRH